MKQPYFRLPFILAFCALFLCRYPAIAQNHLDLVPLPAQLTQNSGVFSLTKESRLIVSPAAGETADYFATKLRQATKYPLPIVKTTDPASQKKPGDLVFDLSKHNNTPKEGYTLSINTENVLLSASEESGLFYGVQTLLQLLPPTVYSGQATGWEKWEIPSVTITDYPRFGHRGLMLDVSRQFYDVATVKKYLDWMAMIKLNVFHWHLTDDNGWRIEIKKYPKLTQLGAWRGPNEVLPPSYGSGSKRYGGFYTQKEIKEVIAYAQKLHINIIPEIELPGHSRAVTSSYPEILCESTDMSLSVNGENKNLWCIAREANYKMLDDIIAEVANLFPWDYIHIGGDEVNPAPWKECPHCQALMAKEHMENIMDLQAYFAKRMETIVEKHGKKMIGWQEIIDRTTLKPTTTVHAWRTVEQTLIPVRKGHPTIMQPAQYTYLDMKQTPDEPGHNWAAVISLEHIYSYDPVGTAKLSPEESKLVLGVQSGLWGEVLDRPARIPEYQLFPRLCALAEIGWTPLEKRKWDDFNIRIGRTHFDRMYEMGIAFRVPPPTVEYKNGMIIVTPPFPWSVVRFAGNDSIPDLHSPVYHYPIITNEPWKYKFATFYRDKYISPAIAGANKIYKTPLTTAEVSFVLQPRHSLESVTDYKFNTYVRSTGQLKEGDYIIYRFAEPLTCEKITVTTGIPSIPIYYMESGYVMYSLDGETFTKAGDLVYGELSFSPPKGIKAVKIVAGKENYSVQNGFMDLRIE